jgi:hypothetical protein
LKIVFRLESSDHASGRIKVCHISSVRS